MIIKLIIYISGVIGGALLMYSAEEKSKKVIYDELTKKIYELEITKYMLKRCRDEQKTKDQIFENVPGSKERN